MNFVFDLDGTICFKGKPLSIDIVDALLHLHSDNHKIIIASARPIRDIYPIIPAWMKGLDMIGGNGAFIQHDQKIHITEFECFPELVKIIDHHQLSYLADSDWDYAYTGDINHPIKQNIDADHLAQAHQSYHSLSSIVKLVLFTDNSAIIAELQKLPIELNIHANEAIIDISPKNITKHSGLQQLSITDYIAFGNDTNDISMFKHAKESICIGDHPIAKQYANRVISPEQVAQTILSY